MRIWHILLLLGCGPWAALPATAADFFTGKTINLIVGSAAGGGFDAYARFLIRRYPEILKVILRNRLLSHSHVSLWRMKNVALRAAFPERSIG